MSCWLRICACNVISADLVVAYKGIQKEKEALEASVKALGALQTPENTPEKNTRKENAGTGGEFADPLNVSLARVNRLTAPDAVCRRCSVVTPKVLPCHLQAVPSEGLTCETGETQQLQQMREQLATLTTSLSTLAEEKSKMESTYQAEKKQLRVCYSSFAALLEKQKSTKRAMACRCLICV